MYRSGLAIGILLAGTMLFAQKESPAPVTHTQAGGSSSSSSAPSMPRVSPSAPASPSTPSQPGGGSGNTARTASNSKDNKSGGQRSANWPPPHSFGGFDASSQTSGNRPYIFTPTRGKDPGGQAAAKGHGAPESTKTVSNTKQPAVDSNAARLPQCPSGGCGPCANGTAGSGGNCGSAGAQSAQNTQRTPPNQSCSSISDRIYSFQRELMLAKETARSACAQGINAGDCALAESRVTQLRQSCDSARTQAPTECVEYAQSCL
jgi:hypothetical protein